MKKLSVMLVCTVVLVSLGCKTMPGDERMFVYDPHEKENQKFLEPDKDADELFRVVIDSSHYAISQMRLSDTIERVDDPSGDRYIMNKIEEYDKIDEVFYGVLSVSLYPDSGRIMRVRPEQPTYLIELDRVINEDIQRWRFNFPRNNVTPTTFQVKYRIILRKLQTDEEIMKQIEKMKESN